MIQTHFVPLERPYRIIYTRGEMGLQVGTLIVVRSDETITTSSGKKISIPFTRVITKTHPVVSYVNKGYNQKHNKLVSEIMYPGKFSEAIVWDAVEQSDVATLCLEGQKMLWEDFLNILTPFINECRDENSTKEKLREARSFVLNLINLGGNIQLPEGYDRMSTIFGEDEAYEFQTLIDRTPYDSEKGESKELCYCTELGAEFPFVARTDDLEIAFRILRRQYLFYKDILSKIVPNKPLRFVFEPGGCCEDVADPGVVSLVEKLDKIA